MSKKASTRRERAEAQRLSPTPEVVRRPREAPRRSGPRILGRHLLWFLPLYATLIPAAILVRKFYASNYGDVNLMMGAVGLVALGFLSMVPWARLLSGREDRPGEEKPAGSPADSRP